MSSIAEASKLTVLVQTEDGDSDTGAPDAEVYASSSGAIVDALIGSRRPRASWRQKQRLRQQQRTIMT